MYKKLITSLVIVVVVVASYFVYTHVIQKNMAEKSVSEYMKKQGIQEKDIESKKVSKNSKQGGYFIDITLKDDPGFQYSYLWKTSNQVQLTPFKDGAEVESDQVKYPPLPK